MSLYHLGNNREPEQAERMRRLQELGACLFCPPLVDDSADPDVLEGLEHWVVRRNAFPYHGTRLHLLLVPRLHVTDPVALPPPARAEFWTALDQVHQRFELSAYAMLARCGDCSRTGGTIEHLHLHLIVGDTDDPGHQPVRVKVSSRPPAQD